MANDFNNINDNAALICKAAAEEFKESIQFVKSVAKVDPSEYNGKNGYKSGSTIHISTPARFDPQTTFDITSSKQDVLEDFVPLTLDISSTIGVEVDSAEFASKIGLSSLYNRVISPAITSMAADVEQRMLEKATDAVFNSVGTAGSTTFDTDTILSARERMNKYLCPKDKERFFLSDSTANRSAVNARKGLFNASPEISEQYKMGYMGTADGYNWLENEVLNVHTMGNDVTGVALNTVTVVNGTSSISVSGLTNTTGTVTKGSTFTIAGVFAVHPLTKTAYPFLQQFVVTADATANGSGVATLSISPTIYLTTSRQNVSAAPATTAALVFSNSAVASTAYTQNLAFHKKAFRMVSVPLIMPEQVEMKAQETVDGITIAIVRAWDQNKRSMITRLDFLGGICADRPEWACRIVA